MSAPELLNQLKSGTTMDERTCIREAIGHARRLHEKFTLFADSKTTYRTATEATAHLRGLRDCIRGIALLRNDAIWLRPVQILDAVGRELEAEFGERARLGQIAAALGGGQSISLVGKRKAWLLRADVIAKMAWHIDDLFTKARQGQRETDLPRKTPKGLIVH